MTMCPLALLISLVVDAIQLLTEDGPLAWPELDEWLANPERFTVAYRLVPDSWDGAPTLHECRLLRP